MRTAIPIGLALAAIATAAAYLHDSVSEQRTADETFAFVERYCVDCHNAGEFAGGIAFDTLDRGALHADAEIWEAAVRKLRGRQMPPPGEPRPGVERIDALVRSVEAALDRAAAVEPNPGAPALHRLNRNEYANAVRDLVALPIDAAALLPADDSSEGFDNIASALSVSPAHMQAYVSAAAKISRLAVGDSTLSPEIATYRAPRGFVQVDHVDGLPLGTRGGMTIEHVFPLDAEYEITVGRAGGGFGLATVGADEDAEVTLNGERVRLVGRGDPRSFRLRIPAGPQTLGVAIVQKRAARGVDDLYSVLAASLGVQSLSIMGPFDATGSGDTPSRRRVFICAPETVADETPCAREILRRLASRAFRRPVGEASLDTLMSFYEDGRVLRGFETGIQYALARVLVDPQFIFRFEREPDDLPAGAVYAIDDFELASRLSFFLWSSIPDDALLEAARAGTLRDPDALEREVRRMLADPKADALVENFAGQWLMLRQLDAVSPASNEFDGNLRAAMRRETQMLFASVLREDRSIVDLLDADYTFVDERLARHYGIANVRGSRFRRVELAADDPRRGLLGHASLLTMTSAPNRTSPVRRGAWVLENLLGTPAPPPPVGVETNLEETVGAAPTSLRERLERHRDDPGCASCHRIMDGIGFALENFDATGKWRDTDAGESIDAAGELVDGTTISGPAGLREALLEQRELFVTRFAEKLLTYALGRRVEHYDMPAVRGIVRAAAEDDDRLSALVAGVVDSAPFQMRRKAADSAGKATRDAFGTTERAAAN
jgi:mono/diheme cytochrome c family protein